MELWSDVVGYETMFSVSSVGRVLGKRSGRVLKSNVNKQGREQISTKIGGRKGIAVCFKVHRLVAEAFLPNPEEKPTVNHLDGDPLNNVLSNLEWATHSENVKHAFDTGLNVARKGCDNPRALLSQEAVDYIRKNPSKLTSRKLGEMFKVSHVTILECKHFKSYKPG